MRRFFRSFAAAGAGILTCVREERNFRIHMVVAAYVLGFAPFFSLSRGEWAALCGVIALVLSLEAANAALERAVDLACPRPHPLAKAAKDAAAGAVLLAAAGAAGVAVCLFWRADGWQALLRALREAPWKGAALAVSAGVGIWFIAAGGRKSARKQTANDKDDSYTGKGNKNT